MSSANGSEGADGPHRTEYDWSTTEPSTAVVEVLTDATGRHQSELDTLHDAVDPDALDAVVAGADGTEVSFTYAGHEVTVASDGTVLARPSG